MSTDDELSTDEELSTDGELPEWLSLDDDEEIVWIGQPAFETLYGTIVTGVALLVVLVGVLILLGVPFSYVRITHTDYVATNKSLYVKRGVFSTNIETIDLDRIQNTEFNQSFWGTRFGYGKILISTAGSSGAEITFDGIPDAPTVRDRINELRNERRERRDDGTGGVRASAGSAGQVAAPATEAQLDELIEEVRATREAFERIERQVVEHADDERSTAGRSDTAARTPTDADPSDSSDDADSPDPEFETKDR